MNLSAPQTDALTELINIGYGRAAGALSELTGYRIRMEVPRIAMHAIQEIVPLLDPLLKGDVASVNQIFSGPISGSALLLLDEKSARVLSELLTEENSTPKEFDAASREIITEVGNILLNACLGVFGNLLHVPVSFAVPRLRVDTVDRLMQSIMTHDDELRFALMIHTRFHLRASNVTGYLVMILGITSLDRLLMELEKWELRQQA